MRLRLIAASALLALGACATQPAAETASATDAGWTAFKATYKELIEINTSPATGSCTAASEAMKARLVASGFPAENLHIIVPPMDSKDGNLVAVMPGTDASKGALMLLAHIDVVNANREDWERDPFVLTEEDGYFFARGSKDDKAMAAIYVDTLIRFQQEGYKPQRTIKMLLTCGEEGGATNGVRWLLQNNRELIDSEFAINEGGNGIMDSTGRYLYHGLQAGEKTAMNYKLEVTNSGGHSSRPVDDNAIYELSDALGAVAAYEFPIEFNEVTRSYFLEMAEILGGEEAATIRAALEEGGGVALAKLKENPSYNAILHTTCIATGLEAGHATNALPQRATANVNCRLFPGRTRLETGLALEKAIGDSDVKVVFDRAIADTPLQLPPLSSEIMDPIRQLTEEMWPGIPVVPSLTTGATDGRKMIDAGIPTYGISGIFIDPENTFQHGLNERVPVKSMMEGRQFLYRLTKIYTGGQ
jgi:acetylornithine deacetylase/succinyl-diaminopimelate desuccinylase-like protein